MKGKISYFSYLLVLMISSPALSEELNRLDDFGSQNVLKSDYLVHLYISENCSVCSKQIQTLKECINPDRVAAYLEGSKEERLRTYVKRKKIPFKTFHLTPSTKTILGFGKASPSISFNLEGKMKNIVGLQDCKQISSLIGSESLNQHK